jgi:hypothetical protein
VLRVGGDNIFKLTPETRNGMVTGVLVWPSKMNIDQDGDFTEVGLHQHRRLRNSIAARRAEGARCSNVR